MQSRFPQIPQDDLSQTLLHTLEALGRSASMSPGGSENCRKFGNLLIVLATAPNHYDYLYYTLYSEMIDYCGELSKAYNQNYRKGKEHLLELFNNNVGDLIPYFNLFQISLFQINEQAKKDDAWFPLNTLIWGLFSSMMNRKDLDRFLDKTEDIILNMRNDSLASLN